MHEGILGSNLLQLIALRVQFLPEYILQILNALSGNRRNEDYRKVGRKSILQHLDEFIIQEITLGNGKHTVLIEHLRIEILQLAQQYLIFLLDIIGIARYHKEQQGVALDMAQESQT